MTDCVRCRHPLANHRSRMNGTGGIQRLCDVCVHNASICPAHEPKPKTPRLPDKPWVRTDEREVWR